MNHLDIVPNFEEVVHMVSDTQRNGSRCSRFVASIISNVAHATNNVSLFLLRKY